MKVASYGPLSISENVAFARSRSKFNKSSGGAEKFCRDLKAHTLLIRIGLEATEHRGWLERLLNGARLKGGFGDLPGSQPCECGSGRQINKTPQLLLKLMIEDRFPRVWISSLEHRDLQQLLWHRNHSDAEAHPEPIAIDSDETKEYSDAVDFGLDHLPLGPWGARRSKLQRGLTRIARQVFPPGDASQAERSPK